MTETDATIERGDVPARGLGLVAGAGLLGAIGASSCCILPVGLFSVGAGGAWIGALTALAPYQPYVAAAAVALIAYGFWLARRRARAARAAGAACGGPRPGRFVLGALWAASVLVLAALAFPYTAPFILG